VSTHGAGSPGVLVPALGGLLVRGVGIGSSMMPTMVAAYAVLRPHDVPAAAPQLNVLQPAEHRRLRTLEAEAEAAA
jgi:hypothetical protein